MSKVGASNRSVIGGIARSGSANLLAAGIGSVANLLIVVVVSRGWSPALAGSFFAVTSIFLVTLALAELGVDQGFVRFHARNIALGRPQANLRILRTGFFAVLSVSVLVATVVTLLAGPLGHLVADADTARDATRMLEVLAIALPLAACYDLVLAKTRGHSAMRPTIFVERICRPVLQILLLLLVATVGSADPRLIAAAWAAPYLFGLVATLAWLRHLPPIETAGIPHTTEPGEIGEFWRFTAPRGVARLFQVGLQRADIAIVAALAGPTAGALYTAATRFLVVGQVATQALQQVSEPHLARLIALHEQTSVRSIYHQLTLWSVALTWPLYLVVAVFAEPLITLIFGSEYAAGSLSLTILALTMLFATAMGPVDVLLLMAGRSGLSLVNTGLALAIDVLGCLLLIPILGIEGAAIAWAAAIVGRNLLGMFQVARHLHMTPATPISAAMGLVCIVLFGAIPATTQMLTGSTAAAVGATVVSLIAYLVVAGRRSEDLALKELVKRPKVALRDR